MYIYWLIHTCTHICASFPISSRWKFPFGKKSFITFLVKIICKLSNNNTTNNNSPFPNTNCIQNLFSSYIIVDKWLNHTIILRVGGAGGGNATLSGWACFSATRYPHTSPMKPCTWAKLNIQEHHMRIYIINDYNHSQYG